MAKKTYSLTNRPDNKIIHLFFILFSLLFLIPFLYVISISFSNEQAIMLHGYKLWPEKFDLTAYKMVFAAPGQLIDSYKVTIAFTVLGSFLAVLVMALVAYPLSRSNFKFRKGITFYIYFTMLFNGGLIPTYVLCTQYLHLGNTFWIYIVMNLANAFHIIILRTFFQGLPASLVESAKIDGASELKIFFKIIIPLSKPVLATIALFAVLQRWNEWNIALIYIQDTKLYSLQYLLQKILREAQFMKDMAAIGMAQGAVEAATLPTEGMRFAMAIIASGPMLVVFPFFQKYFTRGLTVGAVKG